MSLNNKYVEQEADYYRKLKPEPLKIVESIYIGKTAWSKHFLYAFLVNSSTMQSYIISKRHVTVKIHASQLEAQLLKRK